jgi:hypothetical protein
MQAFLLQSTAALHLYAPSNAQHRLVLFGSIQSGLTKDHWVAEQTFCHK